MRQEIVAEQQYFQISDRFREAIKARIERLERDANEDARLMPQLLSEDHQRRVALLVAAQIEESVRLRAQLSRTDVTVESIHDVLTRYPN
jgi:ribosome-associated translation inhibitor RaiA